MATRHGTANMLAQNRAFRELEADYSPEVARCLTSRNFLRHGADVSDTEVAAWSRVNRLCCKARLDIRDEVKRAERKAATAAGTAVKRIDPRVKS